LPVLDWQEILTGKAKIRLVVLLETILHCRSELSEALYTQSVAAAYNYRLRTEISNFLRHNSISPNWL